MFQRNMEKGVLQTVICVIVSANNLLLLTIFGELRSSFSGFSLAKKEDKDMLRCILKWIFISSRYWLSGLIFVVCTEINSVYGLWKPMKFYLLLWATKRFEQEPLINNYYYYDVGGTIKMFIYSHIRFIKLFNPNIYNVESS